MNLSFYIARRYLFSKKSHNAINVISLVSVCGVTVATLATICTLSVFNGFQGLVADMFGNFDPELKVTPVKGKVFDPKEEPALQLFQLPEIETISEVLEDNVFLSYRDRQVPAVFKGVSDNFDQETNIKEILLDGDFKLHDEINSFATLGIGLAHSLGINAGFVFPIEIYAPKRNVPVNLTNPSASITTDYIYIGGVFQVNQAVYDENYFVGPIALARSLFDYENEVSALEIKFKKETDPVQVQKKIEQLLGDDYVVRNQYQQQETSFKMMNSEKWVSFVMLCFIMILAAFNVISSLSMLVIEKDKDIITLRNMGADNPTISRIFLFEGWMISALGGVVGLALGILICLGQQHFGWLQLGNAGANFAVNAYPVQLAFSDILFTLTAVLAIGFLAALYPVHYINRKYSL